MMKDLPSFCIILPMYNEMHVAEACIRSLYDYLSSVSSKTAIIAINDGSQDNTLNILTKLQNIHHNLIVESHKINSGYGAACRTGFMVAVQEEFDYALVMDADGTQNPRYITNFFEPMLASYDYIKATRYSKKGRVQGVAWKRRIISWFGNKLAKLIYRLPLSDYTNGFRMIKTSVLEKLNTRDIGFAVLLEEVNLAKKLGATFYEVPYTLTVRKGTGSQSKFVYSFGIYKHYLKHLFN